MVYSSFQILTPAILNSVFCLSRFRSVLEDDFLRFFISLVFVFTGDLYISTFVNFTYLAFPFFIFLYLDAISKKSDSVPIYAYLGGIFLFGKIFLHAIIPMMAISFRYVNKSYKRFFLYCITLSLIVIFYSDLSRYLVDLLHIRNLELNLIKNTGSERFYYFIVYSLNNIASVFNFSQSIYIQQILDLRVFIPITIIARQPPNSGQFLT